MILRTKYHQKVKLGLLLVALGLGMAGIVTSATPLAFAALSSCAVTLLVRSSIGKPEPSIPDSTPSMSTLARQRRFHVSGCPVPLTSFERAVWSSLKTTSQRTEWEDTCKHVRRWELSYLLHRRKTSPIELSDVEYTFGSILIAQGEKAVQLCEENSRYCPTIFRSLSRATILKL